MRRIPRRLRQRFRDVLGAGEPPRQVAAAFALGVAISFSPLLGFHTLIALVLAFLLRLNKPDMVLGTLVINPWTFPVYFPAAIWLGRHVTGIHFPWADVPAPNELLQRAVWESDTGWIRSVLTTWGVGASLCAVVLGTVTYVLLVTAITTARRRAAARALGEPRVHETSRESRVES